LTVNIQQPKKKIGETEYGIGWLPLGGFVNIKGDEYGYRSDGPAASAQNFVQNRPGNV
jgi:membrane-associated protease RseP (regulator of RpoE activity)